MKTKMKTHHALCGLLSGLLLLAAGTAQTHAGLLVPAAAGSQLYVANYNNNTVDKITPGGVGSLFANTGMSGPHDLAFDSAGNLYVANFAVGLGTTIEKFTPGGVGSVFASTGLSGPVGLAFDGAGDLYAANWTTNTIEKFTPGGVGSLFANTGLSTPFGLAFDGAGNLFASNVGNNTIEKFSSVGADLGVFADSSDGLNQPAFLAFAPAPEPTSAALLLGSGAMLLLRRRRAAAR